MKALLILAFASTAAVHFAAAGAQTVSDGKPVVPAAEVVAEPAPPQDAAAEALRDEERTTDIVTIEREPGSTRVVCRWTRRNGSNFRERRCRTREQAAREERQADYALRRMTGF